MLFNSYIFVMLFLPLALLGYHILNQTEQYKYARVCLLGMSWWFIGYMNVIYLPILLISMAVNYAAAEKIHKSTGKKAGKLWLAAGVIFNLSGLFLFKYFDFFAENTNALFHTDLPLLQLILPIGISFYTFQQLTYLIDCYRDQNIHYGILEYALYISFFPQFIQGPIVLQSEMLPQLLEKKKFQADSFARGIYAFAMGMGKKVLLADTLAKIVQAGYGNIEELNSLSAVAVILAYSLQIYFDFSGYCDMAVGLGEMFGITLPVNFNSPYKAVSIADFWDRWHITLTRFFTRYVYIPLGGSRKGTLRTYGNVFLIFLLSGIWHGAAWTFIFWGILHGAAMVIKRALGQLRVHIPRLMEGILTFLFVNIAWVFFRAESLPQAFLLISRIWKGGMGHINDFLYESLEGTMEISILERLDFVGIFTRLPGWFIPAFLLILLGGCLFMKNTQEKMISMRFTWKKAAATVFVLFFSVMSFSGISEFIYFNF